MKSKEVEKVEKSQEKSLKALESRNSFYSQTHVITNTELESLHWK